MMKTFLISLLLLFPLFAFSQMPSPVKWEVSASKEQVQKGETVEIIIKASINEGWKLYGLGDPEPPHITFTLEENATFKVEGKATEPKPAKKGYDDLLEMNVNYFEKTAEFRQKVKILEENPQIVVEIDAQACQIGQCVPVRKTLTVENIKVTAGVKENPVKDTKKTPSETVKPEVKKTDKKTPIEIKQNPSSNDYSRLESLEKEKKKLVTKDAKGKDETVDYLKKFVIKYGDKK